LTIEPFALERWFASQPGPPRCDLSLSGAHPITLDALLALASPEQRQEFACLPLGYGPPEGSAALRELIAARAQAAPDEILLTCGAIEGLHLAMQALVAAGDEVVVQDPMYPAVAGLARMRGATVRRWPLAYGASAADRLGALASLINRATRLVAITQPNGPTGTVLQRDELDAVAQLLDQRGIHLLSDEVYRDLAIEPGFVVPTAAGRRRTIVVGDVAKPFGLGGLRIGWLVTRDASVRERIRALRDYTTLSVPTPSDALARIALEHANALLVTPLANARANLELLRALAAREDALSFVPPRAGATAFVHVANAERVQRALAMEGVLVVPGTFFGDAHRLRIGLAGPSSDFADALAALRVVVEQRRR